MRANRLLLLSVLAGFQFTANAQHFEWGSSMTGDSVTQIYPTVTSVGPSGVVFSSGFIIGTCNFDPGASNFTISESNVSPFITKRAANGQFLWARTFSSNWETHYGNISIDADGNSYIFGLFIGGLDCDPGAGVHLLTSTGTARNYFLVKLDADGNFVWAQQFGELETYTAGGQIFVKDNMLFCAGVYTGTSDFDNGPAVHELTASDIGNIFVMKLTTDGDFQWAVSVGAADNTIQAMEGPGDITANAAGEVIVTGHFSRPGDFDPGAGVTTLTPQGDGDAFLLKLDTNGDFQWAIRSGGADNEFGLNVAIGPDGSIYQCGNSVGDQPASPNEDLFVAHYSVTGTALWSHQIGGPYMEQAIGLAVDESGAVYVGGDHSSPSVDFDPGAGQHLLTAITSQSYILKLTASGEFVWATSLSTTVPDVIHPSAVRGLEYADGMVYASGYFFKELDLDPGTTEYIVSNNNDYANGFMLKLDTAAIIDVTGINELTEVPFQLYPNPTNGTVTLKTDLVTAESAIIVYNLPGEILLQQQLTALEQEFDLAALPAGTYLVEVRQNGKKSIRPLVKH